MEDQEAGGKRARGRETGVGRKGGESRWRMEEGEGGDEKRSRGVKTRPGEEEREGQEEAGEEEQGGSLSSAIGVINGAEMIFKSILHQVGEREGQSVWSCLKSTLL